MIIIIDSKMSNLVGTIIVFGLCFSSGVGQSLTMEKNRLRGSFVEIECQTTLDVDKIEGLKIQHGIQNAFTNLIVVRKDQNVKPTVNEKIDILSRSPRYVKVNYTKLDCKDSQSFKCVVLDDKLEDVGGNSKMLNVVDNSGDVSLQFIGQKDCTGGVQECQPCNNLQNIAGYAKIEESFEISCEKVMPFPYGKSNVNSFAWSMDKNSDGIYDTISTGITGKNPRQTTANPGPLTTPAPKENCERREKKTSTMTYTPTADDNHLIKVKCRVDLRVDNLRDSKEKEITICVIGAKNIPMTTTPTPGPRPSTTTDAGMIAGIVIAVIAAIILICVLVYFLWYRKRGGSKYDANKENKKYGDDMKPDSDTYDNEPDMKRGLDNSGMADEKPQPYKPQTGRRGRSNDGMEMDNDVDAPGHYRYQRRSEGGSQSSPSMGYSDPIGSAV